MPPFADSVLWLLVLLQVKHALADFGFLTPYMLGNRMKYGHPGGLLHVAVHLAGSAVAFLAVGTSAGPAAALLVAEGVFHYHLDYVKARWTRSSGKTASDPGYWYALGADQLLHQLSYLAIAAWWAGTV